MSDLLAFGFCLATGFVFAATLSSFYQWVTSERADFSIARMSFSGLAVAVLLGMFAGPFIICQKIIAGLRSREMHSIQAAFGVAVAGMWSVCAGIFYLSLLLAV